MKRIFQYILLPLIFVMISFSLNSCREEGVIDDETMAEIYAEMLITDQWINSNPGLRTTADTSLVYEPILKKYGYSAADYRKSLDYYLSEPEEYADVMKQTVKILDAKLAELNKKKELLAEEKELAEYIEKISKHVKFEESALYLTLLDDEKFRNPDSLSVKWDSLAHCFIIRPVEKQKKLLEQTDSLRVDSLLVDTLKVDTLAVIDSLPPVDTAALLKKHPVLDTMHKVERVKKPVDPKEIKKKDIRPKSINVKNVKPLNAMKPSPAIKSTDNQTRIEKVWE